MLKTILPLQTNQKHNRGKATPPGSVINTISFHDMQRGDMTFVSMRIDRQSPFGEHGLSGYDKLRKIGIVIRHRTLWCDRLPFSMSIII